MNTKTLVAAASLLFMSGAANSGELTSLAYVGQVSGDASGNMSTAEIFRPMVHVATVAQGVARSQSSQALVWQNGEDNNASARQTGTGHFALVRQIGIQNTAVVGQSGSGHTAAVFQQGRGNSAVIQQR